MKRTLIALFGVALLAATALLSQPVEAAKVAMCRATAAGTASGPGRVTLPSGTSYTLDVRGCTLAASGDVSALSALGFTKNSQLFSATVSLSAAGTVQLPAGVYIDRVIVQETSGAAITGGLKLGTASGGTQIASALICGSGCLVWTPDASLSTRIFAATAPQTVFIDAVSSWNSAAATITIVYGYW